MVEIKYQRTNNLSVMPIVVSMFTMSKQTQTQNTGLGNNRLSLSQVHKGGLVKQELKLLRLKTQTKAKNYWQTYDLTLNICQSFSALLNVYAKTFTIGYRCIDSSN